MNQKNHTQAENLVASKSAYYQNGAALKEKSPAFRRYIGSVQKLYAGIPFWVLTILMSALAVLQILDVVGMASMNVTYGLLQAVPLLFVLATAALMWTAAFHSKKTSDSYFPIKGMLPMILGGFVLFVISSIAVSFVTGGFGSYLGMTMEEINEKTLPVVIEEIGLKFKDVIQNGGTLGKVTIEAASNQLNSAHSGISDGKLDTLRIGLVFGFIVFLIILAVRAFQVLRAVAISRNSIEYGEKVGEAKITLKQVIIYAVVGLIMALLFFLLDPMLGSMNYVSTGFNLFYDSLAKITFSDMTKAEIMSLTEVPEYQMILSIPMVLIALIGLAVFALVQIYRYIVLVSSAMKLENAANTGKLPLIRFGGVGVVSIALSILMMTNGITWCCSFFFSRVGGMSVLTAVAKLMLIAVVILIAGTLMLKYNNELLVCYNTQCKELGTAPVAEKASKKWSALKLAGAVAICVACVAVANAVMSALDSASSLVIQIFTTMGSYDLGDFGGGLMNEILYTIVTLNEEVMLLAGNVNQIVLRGGAVVAMIALILAYNRFYKAGFSSEATQKARGWSLLPAKILMGIFAVIAAILIIGQLMVRGSWAKELLTLVDSVYVMVAFLALPMFFLRKAEIGKLGKLIYSFVVGAIFAAVACANYFMSATTMMETPEGMSLVVLILVVTAVFQIIRWLYATTYYLETNNLVPVIFFDFLLAMMIAVVAGNASNPALSPEMSVHSLPMVVSLIQSLSESMSQASGAAMKDLMLSIMPSLINLAVIALGVVAMLVYGVVLFVRNMKSDEIPSDELSDFNHVEDEAEFVFGDPDEDVKKRSSAKQA